MTAAGRTGLVLIPEISWARIAHPGDVLAVGQTVPVKVLLVQPGGEFTASVKHVRPERDPWFDPSAFAPGAEFDAPVVRVMSYGDFLELRPEVWGLLKRGHAPRPLAVGDRLRVRVVSSDAVTRRVEVVPAAAPG